MAEERTEIEKEDAVLFRRHPWPAPESNAFTRHTREHAAADDGETSYMNTALGSDIRIRSEARTIYPHDWIKLWAEQRAHQRSRGIDVPSVHPGPLGAEIRQLEEERGVVFEDSFPMEGSDIPNTPVAPTPLKKAWRKIPRFIAKPRSLYVTSRHVNPTDAFANSASLPVPKSLHAPCYTRLKMSLDCSFARRVWCKARCSIARHTKATSSVQGTVEDSASDSTPAIPDPPSQTTPPDAKPDHTLSLPSKPD